MEDLDRLVCISEQVKKKTLEAKREEIIRATKMYRKLIYLGGLTHNSFYQVQELPSHQSFWAGLPRPGVLYIFSSSCQE